MLLPRGYRVVKATSYSIQAILCPLCRDVLGNQSEQRARAFEVFGMAADASIEEPFPMPPKERKALSEEDALLAQAITASLQNSNANKEEDDMVEAIRASLLNVELSEYLAMEDVGGHAR